MAWADPQQDVLSTYGFEPVTKDKPESSSLRSAADPHMATTAGAGASVSMATQDTKGVASYDLWKCDSQCRLSGQLQKDTLTNDFCGHTSNCISGFLNSYLETLETLTGANPQFTREADFQSDKWSRDQL